MGKKSAKKKGLFELPIIGELLALLSDFATEFVGVFSPIGTGDPASRVDQRQEREPTFMMLSPGTQDAVKAIERNVGKLGYRVNLRFTYVAKKDLFNKARVAEFFGAIRQFNSEHLNSLVPNMETMPDVQMKPFATQRNYRRKRLLDRHYRFRLFRKKTFTFNSEELATVFHFPGSLVAKAPSVSRIDSKRAEPPAALPTA